MEISTPRPRGVFFLVAMLFSMNVCEHVAVALEVLALNDNMLSGELPSSSSWWGQLVVLDLSSNHFSGTLPKEILNSTQLQYLFLNDNNLTGTIPDVFPANGCSLESFHLHGNKFEGALPQSFANCAKLQVLDIGNNEIQGMFPFWLDSLLELRVLVLRSNKFNGTMKPSLDGNILPFAKLQVFDISNNAFTGPLPIGYVKSFETMKNVKPNASQEIRNDFSYYGESLVLVIKGLEYTYNRILVTFITVDMSNNRFNGSIPHSIGELCSMRYLNLSHNRLTGHIPESLRSMTELESLDLSSNRLAGEIPRELTSLTFLAKLNFSFNDLVGQIPSGSQFWTFDNSSYMGNAELCGDPLTKACKEDRGDSLVREDDDEDSYFFEGFTWQAVVCGYGYGFLIGIVLGFVILKYAWPKWFIEFFFGARYVQYARHRYS